ncbi:MAG TPA: Rieske (2Fe-2S) protein [Jatrophihabitans sp.]|nr:Rieske (2Fe-2S) protein [Jatrophihabitans sp.]
MSPDPTVTRRTLLVAGAGGIGVAALAACSSSGSTDAADDPTSESAAAVDPPSSSAQSSSAQTNSPASSAQPSSAASSSGSADDRGGSDGKDALISLDDIAVGHAASVKLSNGKPAIVTRLTSSSAVCFSAICTHMGCTVAPKANELDCPCHGSRFNLRTGAVLNGPASEPLAKVPVTVADGKVVAT